MENKEFRYKFRATRNDGIHHLFHVMAFDVLDATSKARKYCEENSLTYEGRIISNKSAYDRVKEE